MEFTVKATANYRDEAGRFAKLADEATARAVREVIEEGANISRQLAPSGKKPDPRTIKLKNSITHRMLSSTKGEWSSTARHALFIEKGTAPHPIPAEHAYFFWERKKRMFYPYNSPGVWAELGNAGTKTISHPGNAPFTYMGTAYLVTRGRLLYVLRGHFPG